MSIENKAHKILVIDDSKVQREMLVVNLKKRGHETFEAVDGEEGYKKMLAIKPDFVFCDLEMPLLDGLGFLKKSKTLHGKKYILTNSIASEPKKECLALGATDVQMKVNYKILFDSILGK